jgi:N6-L-threonylcarbamoyladenine synthase
VVAGGVGANARLRQLLIDAANRLGAEVFFPPVHLCTDNGAMIAYAAAERVNAGLVDLTQCQDHAFTVWPRWPLSDVSVAREQVS